jgi:phosphopantothenoylcysteine decarboxylase/phosphopantothenate--cysteine ligase
MIVDAIVAAIADRPVRAPQADRRPPSVEPPRDADLQGRHIVVSAGGTREAIDPVRFIGNRSTGKMGVAIADAALARGARVTIVAAAIEVAPPDGATVIRVESTGELRSALHALVSDADGVASFDALVMAAAVADFRPVTTAPAKIARGGDLTLQLEATPDVLAQVARLVHGTDRTGEIAYRPVMPRPVLVGFAAETGSLERAADKLRRKRVDLLVANDVSEPGSGFGTDTNRVTILDADGGRDDLPLLSKRDVADRILDRIVAALDARDVAAQTSPSR